MLSIIKLRLGLNLPAILFRPLGIYNYAPLPPPPPPLEKEYYKRSNTIRMCLSYRNKSSRSFENPVIIRLWRSGFVLGSGLVAFKEGRCDDDDDSIILVLTTIFNHEFSSPRFKKKRVFTFYHSNRSQQFIAVYHAIEARAKNFTREGILVVKIYVRLLVIAVLAV